MALVNIANIIVEENPASFLAPLKFKITFEVVKEIQDGILYLNKTYLMKNNRNRVAIDLHRLSKG